MADLDVSDSNEDDGEDDPISALALANVGFSPYVERELAESELEQFREFAPSQSRGGGSKTPMVRLREKHHKLARLVAEGRSSQEVALLGETSVSWVYQLRQDPTFQELVAAYANGAAERWFGLQEKVAEAAAIGVAAVTLDLEHELSARRGEKDEDGQPKQPHLPTTQLMSIAEKLMDRSGKLPVPGKPGQMGSATSAPTTVNVTFVGANKATVDVSAAVQATPAEDSDFIDL